MKIEDQVRLLIAAVVGDAKASEAARARLAEHHEAVTADAAAKAREKRIVERTAAKLGDPIQRAQQARREAEEEIAAEEASGK